VSGALLQRAWEVAQAVHSAAHAATGPWMTDEAFEPVKQVMDNASAMLRTTDGKELRDMAEKIARQMASGSLVKARTKFKVGDTVRSTTEMVDAVIPGANTGTRGKQVYVRAGEDGKVVEIDMEGDSPTYLVRFGGGDIWADESQITAVSGAAKAATDWRRAFQEAESHAFGADESRFEMARENFTMSGVTNWQAAFREVWQKTDPAFRKDMEAVARKYSLSVTKAKYPWDKCIADQKAAGHSDESAAKICGAIKNRTAGKAYFNVGDEIITPLPQEVRLSDGTKTILPRLSTGTIHSIYGETAAIQFDALNELVTIPIAGLAQLSSWNSVSRNPVTRSAKRRAKYGKSHSGKTLTDAWVNIILQDGNEFKIGPIARERIDAQAIEDWIVNDEPAYNAIGEALGTIIGPDAKESFYSGAERPDVVERGYGWQIFFMRAQIGNANIAGPYAKAAASRKSFGASVQYQDGVFIVGCSEIGPNGVDTKIRSKAKAIDWLASNCAQNRAAVTTAVDAAMATPWKTVNIGRWPLGTGLSEADKAHGARKDYNGWTNHATWNIVVQFDNDESLYMRKQKLVKEEVAAGTTAEGLADKLKNAFSWLGSTRTASQVNWLEIAHGELDEAGGSTQAKSLRWPSGRPTRKADVPPDQWGVDDRVRATRQIYDIKSGEEGDIIGVVYPGERFIVLFDENGQQTMEATDLSFVSRNETNKASLRRPMKKDLGKPDLSIMVSADNVSWLYGSTGRTWQPGDIEAVRRFLAMKGVAEEQIAQAIEMAQVAPAEIVYVRSAAAQPRKAALTSTLSDFTDRLRALVADLRDAAGDMQDEVISQIEGLLDEALLTLGPDAVERLATRFHLEDRYGMEIDYTGGRGELDMMGSAFGKASFQDGQNVKITQVFVAVTTAGQVMQIPSGQTGVVATNQGPPIKLPGMTMVPVHLNGKGAVAMIPDVILESVPAAAGGATKMHVSKLPQQQRVSGVATSVYVDPADGMTKVIYHGTPVVSFDAQKIVLNTGGYVTATTATRMNQAANQFNLGYYVSRRGGTMYAKVQGQDVPFNGPTLTIDRASGTAKASNADVLVSNQGSIVLFRPMTEDARAWIEENVQSDAQWFGGALAVEHSYVLDLIDGMKGDGLIVEPEGGAAKADDKMVWATFNLFEFELKLSDAEDMSQSGPVDAIVADYLNEPYIKQQLDAIPADKIRAELKEYGAWDAEELSDDEQNRARILWIASGNIRDGDYEDDADTESSKSEQELFAALIEESRKGFAQKVDGNWSFHSADVEQHGPFTEYQDGIIAGRGRIAVVAKRLGTEILETVASVWWQQSRIPNRDGHEPYLELGWDVKAGRAALELQTYDVGGR
jgi:hypothetical protein